MSSTEMPVETLTGGPNGIGLGITRGRDSDPEPSMGEISSSGQIRLQQRSPSYWRVTFDLPPLNIFGPQNISELKEIITALCGCAVLNYS
jgi:hypothetical protein